ncbi:hypothetical protein KC333_g1236 [Hortaea werneckii]|nr:hypothetical protein KC333_g1236 [Hortaea werneckii]KAI7319089.1 hypothetical protein KC326_g3314 [Hortaea werneckii]
MARGGKFAWIRDIPKRLLMSYILDWAVIVVLAALALGLHYVEPYMRPFSLLDLTISYPLVEPEQIPTTALALLCFVMPAIVIFVVAAVFIPGKRVMHTAGSKGQWIWLKLWEMEQGWAGLCLSLAASLFITQCAKNLFGKPRPSMLARCQPDTTNIAQYVVGGYGNPLSDRWVLVSADICQQPDQAALYNGFRSFPSGHSSFSFAGMLYLTLWLCSKFRLVYPYLPSNLQSTEAAKDRELLPMHTNGHYVDEESAAATNGVGIGGSSSSAGPADSAQEEYKTRALLRSTGASAPLFLFVPSLIPIAIAVYICSTRYVEFYHFGFDIISGSVIGIITAWISFRWYHLPLSQGRGWAWGPRGRNRAFLVGVGSDGWIDSGNSGEEWRGGRGAGTGGGASAGRKAQRWREGVANGGGEGNVRMEGV